MTTRSYRRWILIAAALLGIGAYCRPVSGAAAHLHSRSGASGDRFKHDAVVVVRRRESHAAIVSVAPQEVIAINA